MGAIIAITLVGGFALGIQFHRLYLRKLHKLSIKINRIQRGR